MDKVEEGRNDCEQQLSSLRERFYAANSDRKAERDLDFTRADSMNENERLKQTISELRARIEGLNVQVEHLAARLNQVLLSTSWKVTGPLRVAARRLPLFAQLSRRLVARSSKLFYAVTGRTAPVISPPSFTDHDHTPAACVGNSPETKSAQSDALTKFAALRSRPRPELVLVAAEFPPMLDEDFPGRRLYNLLRVFRQMDRRVMLISRCNSDQFTAIAGSPDDRKQHEEHLYQAGVEVIAYGAEARALIRAVASNLRWAYFLSPTAAAELMPTVRLDAPLSDIVYDMSDFNALRAAHLKSDLKESGKLSQSDLIELTNAKTADLTVVASEPARRDLLQLDQGLAVEVIPHIFEIPSNIRLDISERTGLLFLGGSWDSPAVDGVLWFIREVWPLVRRHCPGITLRMVGGAAPVSIRALAYQPGIEVLEDVPDLIDVFAHIRMSVVPLRGGADAYERVGESLAHGLPVVATSFAADGMTFVHEKHLLIADTAADIANEVIRLAGDDALWRRLQADGLALLEKHADFARERIRVLMNG